MADTAFFGPEAEFFIFDNVQFDAKSNGTFYSVDSDEAIWNTGRDEAPNLGYKIRAQGRLFPRRPQRHPAGHPQRDVPGHGRSWASRSSASTTKWPPAGQAEIDFRFDTLVKTADNMMLYKYVIKNVAHRHGKTVTLHAQAPLRRQRLRHAHPSEPLEERQAPLCGQRNTPA